MCPSTQHKSVPVSFSLQSENDNKQISLISEAEHFHFILSELESNLNNLGWLFVYKYLTQLVVCKAGASHGVENSDKISTQLVRNDNI